MLESTYDQIFEHAAFKRYPLNSSKNERRVIRRRGYEHFYASEGVLYYSAIGTTKGSKSVNPLDRKWRIVVRSCEEGERIIESCHSSNYGEYIRIYLHNWIFANASFPY